MLKLNPSLPPLILSFSFFLGAEALRADTLNAVSESQSFVSSDVQQIPLNPLPAPERLVVANADDARSNLFTDIPEPSSLALGALGGLIVMAARRSRSSRS